MAYTSLHLYRPGTPPKVNTGEVATFLNLFSKLNLLKPAQLLVWANIKFGESIDFDATPTHEVQPTHDYLGTVKEIEWDVKENQTTSIDQVISLLHESPGTVYRCHLGLGGVSNEIIDPLHRHGGDEPLYLNGWSLTLGPVTSYDYLSREDYVIGWVGLTLSGPGSLYPWKPKDLVQRAERMPQLEGLRNLCRETWPVEPKAPESRVQHLREQMGDLWPYERIDKPLDWLWGVG